nr:MAG TPA: FIIR2 tail protein [Caudoviricetes sp.]
MQEEDGTTYRELKGEARGRIIEADPGTDKQGDGGEHKFKIALTYWKETLDGETIVELDFLQNKAIFGGTDERAGLRKALGMM